MSTVLYSFASWLIQKLIFVLKTFQFPNSSLIPGWARRAGRQWVALVGSCPCNRLGHLELQPPDPSHPRSRRLPCRCSATTFEWSLRARPRITAPWAPYQELPHQPLPWDPAPVPESSSWGHFPSPVQSILPQMWQRKCSKHRAETSQFEYQQKGIPPKRSRDRKK